MSWNIYVISKTETEGPVIMTNIKGKQCRQPFLPSEQGVHSIKHNVACKRLISQCSSQGTIWILQTLAPRFFTVDFSIQNTDLSKKLPSYCFRLVNIFKLRVTPITTLDPNCAYFHLMKGQDIIKIVNSKIERPTILSWILIC